MKERAYRLHDGQMGSAITVRVTTRASRNEISEILDDGTVKVRLTSPQNEEKTNQALVKFIAEVLEVGAAQVEIVAGMAGKDKLVTITNLSKEATQERILRYFSSQDDH